MKKLLFLSLIGILLIGCGQSSTTSISSSATSFDDGYVSSSSESNSSFSSYESSFDTNSSIGSTEETYSSSSESSSIFSSYESSLDTNSSISSTNEIYSSSSTIEEIYYTATFLNYDGTILFIDNNVKEGTIPEYKGPTPTKESTYKFNYTFIGWDIPLEKMYENMTYTATFEEDEIYYTIQDLISFNDELPIYYGKEVFLEDVGIVCIYSNDTFCVTSVHNPLDNYSIEVKSKENIKGIYTSKDVVTVIGTLDVINGRPFINNATVSWGYDGNQYSADNAAYIGTVKMDDREYWENRITKKESGNLYYSYMTLASIPEITLEEDISFYITFPGEDIEITDKNIYLIEARIPALTQEEAEYVSTWVKQFNKGDGIYINLQVYYDNKLMVLLPFDILKSSSFNVPYTHKNVYSTYEGVSKFLSKEYSSDYINFPDMSNAYTYNYVTKTGFETVGSSSMKYGRVSFYTYQKEELINHLIDLYSSCESFTYVGLKDDGKYWVEHQYSPNLDMFICFYQGFGKIVFETHFLV